MSSSNSKFRRDVDMSLDLSEMDEEDEDEEVEDDNAMDLNSDDDAPYSNQCSDSLDEDDSPEW